MIKGLFGPEYTPDYLIEKIAGAWPCWGLSLAVYTERGDEWLNNDFFFGVEFVRPDEEWLPDMLATDSLDDALEFEAYLFIVDGLSLASDGCLTRLNEEGVFRHLLFIENEPGKWPQRLARLKESDAYESAFK